MSTVSRGTLAATPARDALSTWSDHGRARALRLAPGTQGDDGGRGIAASIISDRSPRDHAIVATCDGPRTRVYCLDDDAVDGSNANEASLGYDA